jgi:hypothetical protein
MISKEEYVSTLKAMLEVEDPCKSCPAFEGFTSYEKTELPLSIRKGWTMGSDLMDPQICKELCRPFIGLMFSNSCPCLELGQAAIQRAYLAIEAYKNGTHPWCIQETSKEQSKS